MFKGVKSIVFPCFNRYNIRTSFSKTRFTLGLNCSYLGDILFFSPACWPTIDPVTLSSLFPKLRSRSSSLNALISNNYGYHFLSCLLWLCLINFLIYYLHSLWGDKMDLHSASVLVNLYVNLTKPWGVQIVGQTLFWCFCAGVIWVRLTHQETE